MESTEQTATFLDMLFDKDDLFEVRVRSNSQKGANQHWLPKTKQGQFISTHLDIHKHHKRHVWVGVGPRDKVGSTNPESLRVLWVDLDASVTDDAGMEKALVESALPTPSMVVWSGNGYHLYWRLLRAEAPADVQPHVRGVHMALPSDATHDVTRVMRVPGTWNFKDEEHPKECRILKYDPSLRYTLTDFPKALSTSPGQDTEWTPSSKALSTEDFDLFVSNWMEGQKHTMAVGVAGYLRKNLYMTEQEAIHSLASIHRSAGYQWPDENLIKVVKDTYTKSFATVSGLSKLYDLGVVPSIKDVFAPKFFKPKPPKVPLIDFSQPIQPQEFWAHGLVGPGLLTIWAAQPKAGKSFAIMQLGHALSQGQYIWGFRAPKKVRVLYFQG